MSEMGTAMIGTGEATGEDRALRAAEAAIANPLLDETSMQGARGLLISITGGDGLTLFDVDAAASRIRQEVDEEANIIVGATFDPALDEAVRVSVVATGIDQAATVHMEHASARSRAEAVSRRSLAPPAPIEPAQTASDADEAPPPATAVVKYEPQPPAPVIPFPNASAPAVRRRSFLERLGVASPERRRAS
jgi:cell division protein FtsZ